MRWQILCDFDGTISIEDSFSGILDKFAAPEWKLIDEAMTRGDYGSQEARVRQTRLLNTEEAEVSTFLQSITIDPGFAPFLAKTSEAGLPLTIVSDGYDVAVSQVLARHGIDQLDIAANRLTFTAGGGCGVEFPFMDADCAVEAGVCKCAAMGRLRNRKSVMIGNGFSDFCTAGAADFVFAKDELAEHCMQENIPHYRFETFADLVPLVPLIAGDGAGLLALAQPVTA